MRLFRNIWELIKAPFTKRVKILIILFLVTTGLSMIYNNFVRPVDPDFRFGFIFISAVIAAFAVSMYFGLKAKTNKIPKEYRALFPEG
jgi:hypothetical protein